MSAHSALSHSFSVPTPPFVAPTIETYLRKVMRGSTLSREEAHDVVRLLLTPETTDAQAGGMLAALAQRGETVEEIVGVVQAMRARMTAITGLPADAVDTAGTGGSRARGFNVSTAAAIIAAGAGATVAKHGGRAGTSASGSADVFNALGVKIDATHRHASRSLREARLAFLFAGLYHPAMARIAPVRRQLGIRTMFNLAGPLSNPARVRRQVIGVAEPHLLSVIAGALLELGTDHALVVHAKEGLDEISICGETEAIEVNGRAMRSFTVVPEDFGFDRCKFTNPRLTPPESAKVLRSIISGENAHLELREMVICNAAAALYVSGRHADFRSAAEAATESICSGAAQRAIDCAIAISNEEVRA
jgi:anthranilate phosphoribosyltransferase